MRAPLPIRYWPFALCLLGLIVSLIGLRWSLHWAWGAAAFAALTLLGTWDLTQKRRTVIRNYPVLGHLRSFSETIGPNIRQYFIESDTDERPFSREQRELVYERATREPDMRPFGTLRDLYGDGYEWVNHSLRPSDIASHDFRIEIGGERRQPYSASVFNISAMSFGAISPNAIRALNEGARRGRFYHDTGEGSISPYHRENGGDIVWEIGSGYFGCRDAQGGFDATRFAEQARDPQVRMIEIKLSQGAKPGHGGVLPGAKVTAEISATRGVARGVDCISPARHSAFSTPAGLLEFVGRLRELSGGKPVGFKLAIGHPWEWFGIAKAMRESGALPDFIVVDGGEGGTGAAPLEFVNHVGAPLREALMLVHNTLVGLDLRDSIRIGAAGKVTTAFDIVRTLALGADWCNAARGFMFALGCIQSQRCHTDQCPSGVATQDPRRWQALNAGDKAARVHNYHQSTLRALKELLAAAGLSHPDELGPEHVIRRVSPIEIRSLAALYRWLRPGELLDSVPEHAVFRQFWAEARTDTFAPPPRVRALRTTRTR